MLCNSSAKIVLAISIYAIYICCMKNTLNKLVTLPLETAKGLLLLAAQKGMQTKPYMEQILIEHEKRLNRKKSANYKTLNPQTKQSPKK